MTTITRFKEGLKARLAKAADRYSSFDKYENAVCGPFVQEENYQIGDTESGFCNSYNVDVEALNAEIDAFAAEFKKQQPTGG